MFFLNLFKILSRLPLGDKVIQGESEMLWIEAMIAWWYSFRWVPVHEPMRPWSRFTCMIFFTRLNDALVEVSRIVENMPT